MSEEKEVTGKFRYEQDTKRYHRFRIEIDKGVDNENFGTQFSRGHSKLEE